MGETPTLERLIARDRQVTLAGLIVLCALAWVYIVMGAGLGMSAREMTTLALFPHQQATAMATMAGSGMDAMDRRGNRRPPPHLPGGSCRLPCGGL